MAKYVLGLLGVCWLSLQAGAGSLPPIQTVFVIVMENNSWSEIRGNPSAPYINNTLLPMASHCEQYLNLPGIHPSLPNYLWLEAGTNFGILDDSEPADAHQNTTNHLTTLLDNARITWKAYQEHVSPTNLPLTSNGDISARHNPFVYFDDVTGTNDPQDDYGLDHIRPYSELATDLANLTVARYNFIIPDDCNDMHTDCAPLYNSTRQGDNWLAAEVPRILSSQAFQNGGALFILFDEAHASDPLMPMLVISPFAKGGGYASYVEFSHNSMLRTIQDIFEVSPLLGGAAGAGNLSDLFRPIGLRISGITKQPPNGFALTVTGVVPNQPLILQASTNLVAWEPVSTNLSSMSTLTVSVAGEPASVAQRHFRFMQSLP